MVDASYSMRGPSISQQPIAGQNSAALSQATRGSSKSFSTEQSFEKSCENKCNKPKRVLICQQKSSTTVVTAPWQATCSSLKTTKTTAHLTYEQAKTSIKARKRKERQESITSICQERKVIRSNSEERPTNSNNNIRRVSSHEDFKKTNNRDEASSLQVHLQKRDNMDLECEFEKRRTHERFARPLAPRNKYILQSRSPRSKYLGKREASKRTSKTETERRNAASNTSEDNEVYGNVLELHQKETDRSPSPICKPISLALDLTTLHQQIDCTEPLPSTVIRKMPEENDTLTSLSMTSTRLLTSPRNSVVIKQRIYLNPDIPLTISYDTKHSSEYHQKQVTKRINYIKKKIRKCDENFLINYGYKPAYADKLNNKDMKTLYSELRRLKKERSQIIEETSSNDSNKIREDGRNGSMLKNTLHEIEKKLDSKRLLAERSKVIDEMTNEQLIEEKIAVQKGLLYLESQHGRPTNKEDKDLARPLYDRYRLLKRLVAKLNMTKNIVELATIHEHETMDFIALPSTASSINLEHTTTYDNAHINYHQILATNSLPTSNNTDSTDTDTSIGENLHALTLRELYEQQKSTNEDKKNIRRTLKDFELEFEKNTGRKIRKEDKMTMEEIYKSYKNTKSKLKLLDALVDKQAL